MTDKDPKRYKTAEQTFQLASTDGTANQMNEVMNVITDAANQGLLSATFSGRLSPKVGKLLNRLGYRIKTRTRNAHEHLIFWDETSINMQRKQNSRT